MKITKQKATLNTKEIQEAVRDYIERYIHPSVKCTGEIKIKAQQYGQVTADCDVEQEILDPLGEKVKRTYFMLRHRDTGLYVDSVSVRNGRVVLAVGGTGLSWRSVDRIFASLKRSTQKAGTYKNDSKYDIDLLDQLKEDLLNFEVVHFGEVKTDDMTFHIDLLSKL